MDHFGSLTIVSPAQQRQEYVLSKSEISLGRAPTSDIVLNDVRVSRNHARLRCGPSGCLIEDVESVNGVLVNDRKVKQAALASGDQIVLGNTTLEYKAHQEDEEEFAVLDTEHEMQTALQRATV